MSRPALCALLLFAPALRAQPADVSARVVADRQDIKLTGSVRLTLALEGPAPMRGSVALPAQLLTADAEPLWRLRPAGEAEVTPLPGGRERWARPYRLDPFVPIELLGKKLRVTFSPVTVHKQQLTWEAVEVTVTRAAGSDAPPTAPHAVTPIEDLPPAPPPPGPGHSSAPLVASAAALAVGAAVTLIVLVRRGRRAPRGRPDERARRALAQLAGAAPEAVAEGVAAVLRAFAEQRFALPATRLTTGELLAAAREQGWPVEKADALRALLDECDRAKFAGHAPDDDGGRRLVRGAVDWVDDVSRPVGPG